MPKSMRGFASMPKEQQRAIAGLGGKTAHAMGRAHQWTSEEASRARRKGSQHPKKRFLPSASAKRIRSNNYTGMEREYLTPHEVAKQLRVSYRTVLRWIRAGLLEVETIREGKRIRHRIKKTTMAIFDYRTQKVK